MLLSSSRDFPGSPVVKALRFYFRSMGLTPVWGTMTCMRSRQKKIFLIKKKKKERVRRKQEGESGGHHRRRSSEQRNKEGKRQGRGHSRSGKQWWPQERARCVQVWLSPACPVQISNKGFPFGWIDCLLSAVDTCLDQCPVFREG